MAHRRTDAGRHLLAGMLEHSHGDGTMQETGSADGFWDLLNGTEKTLLSTLGPIKDFPPGATMCFEGETATHVYVLVAGWVKILSVTPDGHEQVLALRGHGDIVGELAGETTGRRNATVRAIDTVRALIVGFDRFSVFLNTHPRAAQAYRHVVTQRWSDAALMLRMQPVTNGAQRLAGVVLDLAARHGSVAGETIVVAMPLSQQELASLALTSRATVTRALHSWRKRGYIRTGQRRFTIVDARSLRQIAGQHN